MFAREDRELVMRAGPTSSERNSSVLDKVLDYPDKERKFLETLRMTHPQLLSTDIPIAHHVVWLVASPSDAANVVSTVQGSERVDAIFGPVQSDRGFLFRLCPYFHHSNTVVFLAFPSSGTDEAMRTAITSIGAKWSCCNLIVFSGPCMSLEPLGHPWIISELGRCGRLVPTHNLQQLLGHISELERRREAPWLEELTDQRETLTRFLDQMVWLVRLHSEISGSDSSAWLSSVGWHSGDSLDDNEETLLRFVPDWRNPEFNDYLLKESRQWVQDDSNMLGMRPVPSLKEAVRLQETMPISSHRPHDTPATGVRVGKAVSGGAIDDDAVESSMVFTVADALDKILPGVPRLVCLSSLPQTEGIVSEQLRGLALHSSHDLCIECILHLTSGD